MLGKPDGISLALAAAVVLLACSSDEKTVEKYPTVESFCSAKSELECQGVATKCTVTAEACKPKREDKCKSAANAAIASNRTYRPAAVERCLTETKTLYARPVIDVSAEKTVVDTCERVLTGSKKLGEACLRMYECEGTLVCDKNVCAEIQKVGADAPCDKPGDTCPAGTYCGQKGTLLFCINRNRINDECGSSAPCLETHRCGSSTLSGFCVERLPLGEQCSTGGDCTSDFCAPNSQTCATKLVPDTGVCTDFGGA